MKKHNLKWKIYQQRENCQPQLKSVSIESSPRNANYLIRREVTSRNPQQKNNIANYTKYVLHSNPLSPTSSPNTTKNLIKFDEKQLINQPTITVIDRKHSLSTLSTENRSFKQRLSPINQKAYTESIKVTTQQFTEQNQSNGKENQEDNINDVYGSRIVMQEKKIKYNWLFDENKKRNLKRKLIQLQVKESKRSSNVMDQVIKIIRTINQPSYRFEASQRQSCNWYENVKFEPGSIKKIFTFSQSQFKIYFSQYFDKHLKLYRIIEINNDLLTLINKYHQIEIELKQQRREQFKESSCCCQSKVQNQICLNQFRFTKEIQTYGMIDIINDNSFLSISVRKYSTENQLDSLSQSDDLDETEFFKQAKKIFSTQLTPQHIDINPDLTIFNYKISYLISFLDTKTKNKLLSVDYTIIDKKIYFNNINEMFPTFDDEYRNKHFFKVYSKQYDQFYKDLLEGNYQFLNPISDFEYEAPQNILEIKTNLSISNHDSQGIDKKQMLLNMRQQKIWQSGEVKQKNLIHSENFSPRSTVQVPKNFLEINNQFLESPKISVTHISVSQQNVNNINATKRKSISKSIHGRNAQSPDLLTKSYAQPDILVNCLDDTSQDSLEIRKITMSKSQEQIPKLNSSDVKKDSKKKLITASQQFKMVSSVKSEAIYPDTQSDSQILDKYLDFMTIKNKGASPQSLKLETLLLYQNMLKYTNSKKKKVEILIKHGLLDQFQEFMDLHRNFNLNNYTGNGMPFISLAASNGHEEIVRFMLNFNINLEMLDSNGYPPLYHAMLHNNYNIADLLIQNGANPYFKQQI